MKRFVKTTCVLLAFVLIFAIPAQAAESISTRASNYFGSSSVYLYELSSTVFQAWFHVTGTGTMENIGASEIKIQKSSDNENWTTVKTYYSADYPSMLDENTTAHASYVTYGGVKGYYYRAYIKLYAKNSSGTAVWNRYTSSIYLD